MKKYIKAQLYKNCELLLEDNSSQFTVSGINYFGVFSKGCVSLYRISGDNFFPVAYKFIKVIYKDVEYTPYIFWTTRKIPTVLLEVEGNTFKVF